MFFAARDVTRERLREKTHRERKPEIRDGVERVVQSQNIRLIPPALSPEIKEQLELVKSTETAGVNHILILVIRIKPKLQLATTFFWFERNGTTMGFPFLDTERCGDVVHDLLT